MLVFEFIRSLIFFWICLQASHTFEQNMLRAMLKAPISYFDRTPIGRIVNRFSRDLMIIDFLMPFVMQGVGSRLALFCGYISLLILLLPWYLIVAIPSILIILKLRHIYIASTRELKRIDAITRSPMYNIFSELVAGIVTIRAYQFEAFFISRFERQVNINTRPFFDFAMINRWFAVLLV
jgi:ABC-type multidrug transport system fused ATPase/permease subunit